MFYEFMHYILCLFSGLDERTSCVVYRTKNLIINLKKKLRTST